MRSARLVLLGAVAVAAAACGGLDPDNASGACLLSSYGLAYCANWSATKAPEESNKANCSKQSGTWNAGGQCQGLGYTKYCSSYGTYVKPSSSCP